MNYPQSFNNSSSSSRLRKNYLCDHCKISGHYKERSFKFIGYPPGFKPSQPRRFAGYATNDVTDDS